MLLLLPASSAPPAAAAVEARDLPEGWTGPARLAFDDRGALWLALEGAWALGRWDPATGEAALHPLPTPRADPEEAMGALGVAPDGAVWVATGTRAHRLDPATGAFATFALPEPARLPGDLLLMLDGRAWVALVDRNALVEIDPARGRVTSHQVPVEPGGPAAFAWTGDGALLALAYAGALAAFDPATGRVDPLPGHFDGPVALARAGNATWVAETGGVGVARLSDDGTVARFPASPNPHAPASGPSDVLVHPDGSVWLVEHFAERVARLDLARLWLHEYPLPGAPGTGTERLALGPDGGVWLAQHALDRVARAEWAKEPVVIHAVFEATLRAGGEARLEAHTITPLAATSPDANLTARVREVSVLGEGVTWEIALEAEASLPPGTYHVLLSVPHVENPIVTTGRYLVVTVLPEAPQDVPLPAPLALLAALLALALVAARRRLRG